MNLANELLRGLIANQEAEIARLRRDLEIWRRNGGDVLREAEIGRLRAALLAVKHGAEYPDELGDIINDALANEEGK